jgi:Putative peptidoglycan binding domain
MSPPADNLAGSLETPTVDITVGAGNYIVEEGDCLNSIAFENGFFWKTLWDLPENHELKSARKDPDMLMPEDRVTLPDLRLKQEDGATEKKHRFKRKGVPAKLRLRFLKQGKPLANVNYVLEVDGAKIAEGKLGADGEFEHPILPNAKSAVIRVGNDEPKTVHTFKLGTVPPVECRIGVVRRLKNLGYTIYDDDADSLDSALKRFQKESGMVVTGKPDQKTRDELVKKHGS